MLRTVIRYHSHTKHDKPLGVLHTFLIGLGITKGGNFDLVGLVDFLLGTVTDEHGLSTPLDDDLYPIIRVSNAWHQNTGEGMRYCLSTYVLALRDSTKTNFNLGLGKDISGGGHVDQEVCVVRIANQPIVPVRYDDNNTLSSQCFPQANTILHSNSFPKKISRHPKGQNLP